MFQVLEGDTADDLWLRAAGWFLPGGIAVPQTGRGGTTAEVLHTALTLRDPRQRWIASRAPAISPAFAIAEVVWIMSGRQDSAFLNYFNRKLPEYAGHGRIYHGAYGFRMRRHFGFDQLERAFQVLSHKEDSRQVVLQFWDPCVDMPFDDGAPRAEDIPCNIISLIKIRDNKLEWTQIMRSNDLLRGLPHNIIQFSCLHEILGGWLGCELAAYHHYSDSLHYYASDGPIQNHIVPVDLPPNTDSIALERAASQSAFASLSSFCDRLIADTTSTKEITTALSHLGLSQALMNFAVILAAEGLRRRGSSDAVKLTEAECSNPGIRYLFDRWCQRSMAKG